MYKNKIRFFYVLSTAVFLFYASWWVVNQIKFSPEDSANALFSDTYWVLPLIGALIGLWASKKWGGVKSLFGRSIFFFALGLFAQVFGQVVYTYYAQVQHIEAPYPSIGDIGFFGSIPLYAIAITMLAKTVGARFWRASAGRKAIALSLVIILLAMSYTVFLKEYEMDWSSPLTVLLDFGYPLGQAIYVSLALLAYILSRGLLGGIMKNKILLLLAAFVIQYTADYSFLYRFNRDQWYAGDFSDFIYLCAYFLMTVALLKLVSVANGLKAPANPETPTQGAQV
jgi:hypothetical protein